MSAVTLAVAAEQGVVVEALRAVFGDHFDPGALVALRGATLVTLEVGDGDVEFGDELTRRGVAAEVAVDVMAYDRDDEMFGCEDDDDAAQWADVAAGEQSVRDPQWAPRCHRWSTS